ncbi:hypothetical protein [Anabaena azotica]|nr:hypothetical protein [Anabaena azotica]
MRSLEPFNFGWGDRFLREGKFVMYAGMLLGWRYLIFEYLAVVY